MTNYYGYPPGYAPNPHHPRPSTSSGRSPSPAAETPIPTTRHARARLDGGQWISRDGEWIYTERFGLWRAAWDGDGYGAWEVAEELPEGVVKL